MSVPPPPDRPHVASLVEDFRRHGNQTAIVSRAGLRQQRTSYRDLADLAERFAAELSARGISKGDRVLIWGENGAAWIGAFFGCILRGVIAVPIDVAGSTSFAQRVAQEVAPKLVTGSREQLRLLESASPRLAFEDFASALTVALQPAPFDGIAESDPVQIVFTSGTTGEPKGVVHTHGNILASLRPIEREMRKYLKYERIFHPLRFLHTLPLSHVFGQFMGIWIPALLAAEVHFESQLIPGDLVARIRQERISVLAAVPRVLEVLQTYLLGRFADLEGRLKRAEGLPAWRRWWLFRDVHRALGLKFWALICGGATLPPQLEHFWNTLGLVVIQGYGSTETSALVSLNHPFHAARGSIGKVLPGREIRLGADGEILVRGATVSNATWERGQLHARASDWLATGDLASVDDAGNLKFRGRKKEVIVTAAGLNIYPDDLEAALLRQPQIRAAAVVETAGPSGGEPLAALVVRNADDATAAVRAANRELAEYQQIRRWVIWPDPDLPRTSTGKVLRREVAAALRGQKDAATPSAGMLEDLIFRITGDSVRLPDSALLSEDLHLDSLGRVELQSMLESRLGLEIDEAAYQQARTLGELKTMLTRSNIATVTSPEGEAARSEYAYPRWPWMRLPSAIRVIFLDLITRPLVTLLGKPQVRRDLDETLSGPVLIVANHATTYDVPLILSALPWRVRHRLAVAMAGEMLDAWRHARGQANIFFNLIAPIQYLLVTGLFNVFPLPQTGNFRKSFAHAGRAMDAGFHVLVFPEGRRSPDGLMHSFQAGSGMLWQELRTHALPVYLGGLGELKVGQRRWFRSNRISIRIGKLIPFSADRDAAEAARVLERAVRQLGAPDDRIGDSSMDNTSQPLDPGPILQTAFAFWSSKVLLTAVEFGVFTKLGDRRVTGPDLGAELGLHPRAVSDFFDALVAMRFLDREGDGPSAKYFNTPAAALYLDSTQPRYVGGILVMLNARLFKFWNDLPDALRTGRPQNEIKHGQKGMFEELYDELPRLEQFLGAMTGLSRINFEAFAEKFDFSRFKTLCDVGGATGLLCVEAAKAHPHLRCTSFDLPPVEPIARKHIAAAGLSDRVATASGDFFKDPLPKADMITMGMILHDWNLEKKMQLIRAAYDALPSGGALVAIEALIDDARRENVFGLLMSLNMLIEFGDAFDYSGADFRKWCGEAGFQRFEVIHLAGPSSAAIAYK